MCLWEAEPNVPYMYTVAIERLELCEQLQTLVLSNNLVDSVRNLYCCRQLWSINLSGNKVCVCVCMRVCVCVCVCACIFVLAMSCDSPHLAVSLLFKLLIIMTSSIYECIVVETVKHGSHLCALDAL